MVRKLPKGAEDWHERLIEACRQRYENAVIENKASQAMWKKAYQDLLASQQPVYLQKSGEKKGLPVGIPKSLKPNVMFTLVKIMLREEEIDVPNINVARNVARQNNIGVKDERVFKNMKYRSSAYAILATLYTHLDDDGSEMSAGDIKRSMSRYTDHPIDYDYRTRKAGAWTANKDLVARGYLQAEKTFMSYHNYRLTQAGRELCYALFNDKFHPKISDEYALVKPRCVVTRDGRVHNNRNSPVDQMFRGIMEDNRERKGNQGLATGDWDYGNLRNQIYDSDDDLLQPYRGGIKLEPQSVRATSHVTPQQMREARIREFSREESKPATCHVKGHSSILAPEDEELVRSMVRESDGNLTNEMALMIVLESKTAASAGKLIKSESIFPPKMVKSSHASSSSSSSSEISAIDVEEDALIRTMVSESGGALNYDQAKQIISESCKKSNEDRLKYSDSNSEIQCEDEYQTTLAISASLAEFSSPLRNQPNKRKLETIARPTAPRSVIVAVDEQEDDELRRAIALSKEGTVAPSYKKFKEAPTLGCGCSADHAAVDSVDFSWEEYQDWKRHSANNTPNSKVESSKSTYFSTLVDDIDDEIAFIENDNVRSIMEQFFCSDHDFISDPASYSSSSSSSSGTAILKQRNYYFEDVIDMTIDADDDNGDDDSVSVGSAMSTSDRFSSTRPPVSGAKLARSALANIKALTPISSSAPKWSIDSPSNSGRILSSDFTQEIGNSKPHMATKCDPILEVIDMVDSDEDEGLVYGTTAQLSVGPDATYGGASTLPAVLAALPVPKNHLIELPDDVNESHFDACLLVDTRERKDQLKYRTFFNNIRKEVNKRTLCGSSAAVCCEAREVCLALGDFLVVLEKKNVDSSNIYTSYEDGDESDSEGVSGAAVGTVSMSKAGKRKIKPQSPEDDPFVFTHIVERKALTDIIPSSSQAMTARHFIQERRLRFSGILFPTILVEGIYPANGQIRPFRFGNTNVSDPDLETTFWQADVLQDYNDVICHLTNIIARNVSIKHRVYIMQTNHDHHTVVWLAAMTACAKALFHESIGKKGGPSVDVGRPGFENGTPRPTLKQIRLSQFMKFARGWGGDKVGRQSELKSRLESIDHTKLIRTDAFYHQIANAECTFKPFEHHLLSNQTLMSYFVGRIARELNERVMRRFGDEAALRESLFAVRDTAKRGLLLKDLSMSSTNHACTSLTRLGDLHRRLDMTGEGLQELYESRLFAFVGTCLGLNIVNCILKPSAERRDSTALLPDSVIASQVVGRHTKVIMSPKLFDFMEGMTGFDTSIQPKRVCDIDLEECDCVWGQIMTVDQSLGLRRQSEVLDVVVCSGNRILEALLKAVEAQMKNCITSGDTLGKSRPSYDIAIVRSAVAILLGQIDDDINWLKSNSSPALFSQHRGIPMQRIIIVENLIGRQANSGALNKLRLQVSKLEVSAAPDSDDCESSAPLHFSSAERITLKADSKQKKSAGKNAESFAFDAARRVGINGLWYVNLLFCFLQSDHHIQIFQSCNEHETKLFISSVAQASKDSSVLLY